MEKMTLIFFIIIVVYLIFSYVKSRKTAEKTLQTQDVPKPAPAAQLGESGRERAAIAAVIAAVMGEAASYTIKRVYPVATVDEKKSSWRNAGRIEAMSKKPA